MSDLFQDIYGKNAPYHRVCRVAYTLGNDQPVTCTHIGDQPLFYMEYEDDCLDDEEDEYFVADCDLIERELQTLRREIAELERETKFFTQCASEKLALFSENAGSLTVGGDTGSYKEKISSLKELLSKSRLGNAYLDLAAKHKVEIILSKQFENGFYDRRTGKIFINPDLAVEDQILLLTRELRRHWQHREGAMLNPLTFLPEQAVLVNRMQQADLTVSVIRTAWELQLAGQHNIWERIENSSMADLGRAFAREAFMDFRTINNGIACASVLEAWFLSERCRHYDKKIIQSMLSDYKGYVFENTAASKSITAELIAALGTMPFGKNYLAQHAATIMNDPIFSDVRDRSNANFLWFIKFERSFKETEQELQNGSDLSTHDIRHEVFNTRSQSNKNDTQHSAEIITLFDGAKGAKPARGKKPLSKSSKRGQRGAQIIDIRAWSASK